MAKKSNAGRPTKMTPETVNKLEQAFINGATDEEACFYAGISKQCLYNYQDKNPEYVDRKSLLKQSLSLRAKNVVAKSIESGNVQDAKWHLERKNSEEYSTKTDASVHNTGNISITINKKVHSARDSDKL